MEAVTQTRMLLHHTQALAEQGVQRVERLAAPQVEQLVVLRGVGTEFLRQMIVPVVKFGIRLISDVLEPTLITILP